MDGTVPRPTLRALTGLRFAAALHVVLFHTALPFAAAWPAPVRNVVAAGYTSVGLFFVLSGFVLAYQYTARTDGRPIDERAFAWARAARIYPEYCLALLFSLPAFVHWSARVHAEAAPTAAWATITAAAGLNAALLQAWVPRAVAAINPPGWSLSTEAFFYLVFPLAAVRVVRLGRRRLLALGVALWVVSLVAPALYVVAEARGLVAPDARELWSGIQTFNPLLRLPEFLIGVLAGRLFLGAERAPRGVHATHVRRGGVLALAAAAALVAALAASSALPTPLLRAGLLAPLFAALVYGLAFGGGSLARLLARPWLVLLGQASYALYLLHMRLADYVVALSYRVFGPLPAATLFALYLAGAVALSVAVFLLVEEPARRAIRRAARPPRHERPAPITLRTAASQTPATGTPRHE
jgi:peptidoglycan/LPS O-acetylase OafA/YrhL